MSDEDCYGFSFLKQDIQAPAISNFSLLLSKHFPDFKSGCSIFDLEMIIKRIMGFVAIFNFFCILFYHFYQFYKYNTRPIKTWIDNSIFSIFEEKNIGNSLKENENLIEHDEFNKIQKEDALSPEKNSKKSGNDAKEEENRRKNENLEKNMYLFDLEAFFKFFCPNCFVFHFYTPFYNCMQRQSDRFKKWFSKYIKSFSFFCVVFGIMLFHPLDYIISLIFANKCLIPYDITINYTAYIFMVWDLLAGFIYTFTFYFLVTFIVLRREIQRIQPEDKLARAELLWFTFRKGFIFGVIIFSIKLLAMINTGTYFPEIGQDPVFAAYSLSRELIFISVILQTLGVSSKAIRYDFDVVKEEANLDLMLHHLYRNSLGKINVYKFLKLESEKQKTANTLEFDETRLEEYLENRKKEKFEEIGYKIKINNHNIFKNVLLKSFQASSIPKITIWIITLDISCVMLQDVLILASFKISQTEICENYYLYIISILSLIIRFLDFFVLPKLFFESVRKRNFFGKDEEDEVKDEND